MTRDKINRMNKALVHWDEVNEAIERISQEYEGLSWGTLVLHPGDVSTRAGDTDEGKFGFQLVIPDSELTSLADLVGDTHGAYDEFEVYRAPNDELSVFIVVMKSADMDQAIVFPIYYDSITEQRFVELCQERDSLHVRLTDLVNSDEYQFKLDNPGLFHQ